MRTINRFLNMIWFTSFILIEKVKSIPLERRGLVNQFRYIIYLHLMLCVHLCADTWAPPEPQRYCSSNKNYCLEIIPGDSMHQCQGILSAVGKKGEYHRIWATNLANAISPVTALVSDDGDYVVTFDNWYRIGWGNEVVVIYGANGALIKKYGLGDILSEDEIEKIPRTVASRWWGGEHVIDEEKKTLILKVVSNGEMPYSEEAQFNEIHIDLKTGELTEDSSKVDTCPLMRWIRELRDRLF